MVLAYIPAEKEEWNPYEYGETMLLEEIESVHPRYAISWRIKWMVNKSEIVIAYITHSRVAQPDIWNLQQKKKTNHQY